MEFKIKTHRHEEMTDITKEVKAIVDRASDEDSRAVSVFVPHTTCGIVIQENADPDVREDILGHLKKIVPEGLGKHSEGNSDSHIKSVIVGSEKVIPIQNGLMLLGKWQGIFLAEFDGPRERTVIVRVI